MSNPHLPRDSLRHTLSESEVHQHNPSIELEDLRASTKPSDIQPTSNISENGLHSRESSCTPPPLPPRPPKEDCRSDHSNPTQLSPQRSTRLRGTCLWPRFGNRALDLAKDDTERDIHSDDCSNDFVRDERNNMPGVRRPKRWSRSRMMSGALPAKVVETFAPADELPPTSRFSFDSTFDADAILQPRGFDTFSGVFSNCAMAGLSRCVTPAAYASESDVPVFRRPDHTAAIDEVLSEDERPELHAEDHQSMAARLPTELLHNVYNHLGPTDFNAARHTCLTWMSASLHLDLLTEQLKRGGWWSAASTQPLLFQEWRQAWPMSCYLARQCALAGNWTGCGLSPSRHDNSNPLIETANVEFHFVEETTPEDVKQPESRQIVSTASVCGKYYVIAIDSEIYTYEIEGCFLHLLSRTLCEQRVLAVSVDFSSKRFAIAALLEGRVGLYIDMLAQSVPSLNDSPWDRAGTINGGGLGPAPVMEFETSDGAGSSEVPVGDFDELSLNAVSVGSNNILHHSVELSTQQTWSEYSRGPRSRLRGMRQMPTSTSGIFPESLQFPERGKGKRNVSKWLPQIVYKNVCTEDDPPCSIAISPTRQCVAFGCKTGVELYWIDPSTGRNLNRWFSLAKPSDHLYFLPPRQNIDNALRLRLISSADYECAKDNIGEDRASQSPHTASWFTLTASWRFPLMRTARRQAYDIDHSYALPLSDGHHILFTDNETGLLCMGSDRPRGNLQRLSRKFVFESPAKLCDNLPSPPPNVYAAAQNLNSGVRIVAGYGDDVVLYSVPVDALKYSTAEQEGTIQDSSKPFEELEWIDVLLHPTSNALAMREDVTDAVSAVRSERLNMLWTRYLPASGHNVPESLDTLWPLKIPGTCIGILGGLKALSVQDTVMDGLVIWAFSTSGAAKAWKIDGGERPMVHLNYIVGNDGIVRESQNSGTEIKQPFLS